VVAVYRRVWVVIWVNGQSPSGDNAAVWISNRHGVTRDILRTWFKGAKNLRKLAENLRKTATL
jgi:hypothetical protein